eukprot:133841-Pyramimonas_sp.AAC.1
MSASRLQVLGGRFLKEGKNYTAALVSHRILEDTGILSGGRKEGGEREIRMPDCVEQTSKTCRAGLKPRPRD